MFTLFTIETAIANAIATINALHFAGKDNSEAMDLAFLNYNELRSIKEQLEEEAASQIGTNEIAEAILQEYILEQEPAFHVELVSAATVAAYNAEEADAWKEFGKWHDEQRAILLAEHAAEAIEQSLAPRTPAEVKLDIRKMLAGADLYDPAYYATDIHELFIELEQANAFWSNDDEIPVGMEWLAELSREQGLDDTDGGSHPADEDWFWGAPKNEELYIREQLYMNGHIDRDFSDELPF